MYRSCGTFLFVETFSLGSLRGVDHGTSRRHGICKLRCATWGCTVITKPAVLVFTVNAVSVRRCNVNV